MNWRKVGQGLQAQEGDYIIAVEIQADENYYGTITRNGVKIKELQDYESLLKIVADLESELSNPSLKIISAIEILKELADPPVAIIKQLEELL
jgi:hypothetical protein